MVSNSKDSEFQYLSAFEEIPGDEGNVIRVRKNEIYLNFLFLGKSCDDLGSV